MSKPIPVTIEEDLLEYLREAARLDGRSVSNLVRKWVKEELEGKVKSKSK
jgi:flagellar biosynthesis/type III secretory pathway M-ring protein FliF/YscJ